MCAVVVVVSYVRRPWFRHKGHGDRNLCSRCVCVTCVCFFLSCACVCVCFTLCRVVSRRVMPCHAWHVMARHIKSGKMLFVCCVCFVFYLFVLCVSCVCVFFFVCAVSCHVMSCIMSRHDRKTLLEAANRHKDGGSGADSGGLLSGVDGYAERKASFSSNTNTHHRYRYKDKRCVCARVCACFCV